MIKSGFTFTNAHNDKSIKASDFRVFHKGGHNLIKILRKINRWIVTTYLVNGWILPNRDYEKLKVP